MQIKQQIFRLFMESDFKDLIKKHKVHNLSIQFNTRLKKTWQVKIKPNNQRFLVVPALLQSAPKSVKIALIKWALFVLPHRSKMNHQYYQRKRALEEIIWKHLSKQHIVKYTLLPGQSRNVFYNTQGVRYNLREVFDYLNTTYFGGKVQSHLRWGRYGSKISYQSSITDNNGKQVNLITIGGVYNHDDVPRYAIESILYHEMLHIVIPPVRKNGRNVIHGQAFKKAEQAFPYYDLWIEWERKHLFQLAHRMKKKKRS